MNRSLVAAALAMLAASSVHAQTSQRHYGTQCTPGALHACASVDIATYYDPDAFGGLGMTEIRVTIANPQGLPGFTGNPTGFNGMWIRNLQGVTGNGIGINYDQTASSGTAHVGPGALDTFENHFYHGATLADVRFNYDMDSYLFGCDLPVGYAPFGGYDSTCNGTITITMRFLRDDVRLTNQSQLTMDWVAYNGPNEADGSTTVMCTTDLDCVTVTPEPITLVMLGTGMAGLGIVRRRRKREEDV